MRYASRCSGDSARNVTPTTTASAVSATGQQIPVQPTRVAQPQSRHAEGDQVERDRHDEAGPGQQHEAGRQRCQDRDPRDGAQALAPPDEQHCHGQHHQAQGAARTSQHLEPGRRLDQQREYDHGRGQRMDDGTRYQAKSTRAVGEDEPQQSVCERQGDADLRRKQARFRHRTQEKSACEYEEESADEGKDGDRIVRVPLRQAT